MAPLRGSAVPAKRSRLASCGIGCLTLILLPVGFSLFMTFVWRRADRARVIEILRTEHGPEIALALEVDPTAMATRQETEALLERLSGLTQRPGLITVSVRYVDATGRSWGRMLYRDPEFEWPSSSRGYGHRMPQPGTAVANFTRSQDGREFLEVVFSDPALPDGTWRRLRLYFEAGSVR